MKVALVPPPAARLTLEPETAVPAVAAGGGLVLWVWSAVPALMPHPMACLFHVLTGLPCPGCGGTRALLALTRLDLAAALAFNPAAALGLLGALVFTLYAVAAVTFRTRRIRLSAVSQVDRVAVVALVLANWVYLIAAGR